MKSLDRNFRVIIWACSCIIALSLLVLIGWIFDIALFKTIVPEYVSMKLNTALFFLLTTVALLLYVTHKWPYVGFFLAAILTISAMASLSQDLFGIDFGIDEFFISDLVAIEKGAESPGRPSPMTSFCFLLFGLVLLTVSSNRFWVKLVRQYALHIITLIVFIAVLGYLFNVPSFYKLSFFTSMAIHTSVSFLVLSLVATLSTPELGVTGLFLGNKIGNLIARKLFAVIFIAILVLGYLQLNSQRLGLVSVEFGVTLFTTSFILIVLYALWSTAKVLNRMDVKRKLAEERLVMSHKNLEKVVEERTEYLTKQNKQLENFAHIVSHDLRGPTSNLKSLLYIHGQETETEEREAIMEKFSRTVNNLESTLNELLEVVSIRHESKKEKKTINFENVLLKLIETYQGKIMESNAKITYDFASAKTIEYSAMYLESIMQNLLSNAIKYRSLERTPEIHFETDSSDEKTTLKVRDNGLGINMKTSGKHLFGLHKTFHRHPGAKGVGLFITKAQVEAMGGEITADSEVDKGSTFTVNF